MPPIKHKHVQESAALSVDDLVTWDYCHVLFQPWGIKSYQANCTQRPEKVKSREEFADAADKVVEAQLIQGASEMLIISHMINC